MIILLNAEAILFEVMAGARARIAITLGLPESWVDFELKRRDGERLFPEVNFNIPDEVPDEIRRKAKYFTEERDRVKELTGQIVRAALREFKVRKEGARA